MQLELPNSPEISQFEFQKWPVYIESIKFVRQAHELSVIVLKTGNRQLVDQLRRASQSVPLNIAEGSGRHTTKDKMNFFRIARGSIFECVAIIDLIHDMHLIDLQTKLNLQASLASLGKMLSGFLKYLEKFKEKAG